MLRLLTLAHFIHTTTGKSCDDDQEALISKAVTANWLEITGSWPPAPTQEALWAEQRLAAQAALDYVTGPRGTVMRCLIAGVPLPAAWQAYITSLRAIVSAASGDPAQPLPQPPKKEDGSVDYPAGT